MNKVELTGRLTKDPEVKMTPSNIAVCSFSVACDRRFKTQSGDRQTDFIPCVAWRQQAELLGNYFHKGSRIEIVGSLQTRSYEDQNKQKRTVVEVVVDEIYFVDTKSDATATQQPTQQPAQQSASVPTKKPPLQAAAPVQTPPPVQAVMPDDPVQEMDIEGDAELPFDVMGIV